MFICLLRVLCPVMIPVTVRSKFLGSFNNSTYQSNLLYKYQTVGTGPISSGEGWHRSNQRPANRLKSWLRGAVDVSSARSDCFVPIEAGRNTDGATSYLWKRPTNFVGSYGSIRGVIFSNTFTTDYFFDAATSRASRFTASVSVFCDSPIDNL